MEDIVPGAAKADIPAPTPIDVVVPRAADNAVVAGAALEFVRAGTAEDQVVTLRATDEPRAPDDEGEAQPLALRGDKFAGTDRQSLDARARRRHGVGRGAHLQEPRVSDSGEHGYAKHRRPHAAHAAPPASSA